MHYVSNVLGIKDPIHKQKIALKAMDVVLFGPPRGEYFVISFLDNLSITCLIIRRNWSQMEGLHSSDPPPKCYYWVLVCVSAE